MLRTLATSLALGGAALSASAYDPDLVVVRAGTVITAAGEPIEGGVIVIEDGVITVVGPGIEFPKSAHVIDARDQFVMPGIVVPATRLGLDRYQRNGLNANLSAADEVYPAAMDNTPWFENGVVAVGYAPDGFGIPGSVAGYLTADPFPDDGEPGELIDTAAYYRVTLTDTRRDKKTLREAITKARAEIKKAEEARKKWDADQAKKAEAAEKAKKEAEEAEKQENGEGDQPAPEPKPEPKPDQKRRRAADNGDTPPKNGDAEKTDEPEKFVPPEIDPKVKPLVDMLRGEPGALVIEIGSAGDFEHLMDILDELDLLPPDEKADEKAGKKADEKAGEKADKKPESKDETTAEEKEAESAEGEEGEKKAEPKQEPKQEPEFEEAQLTIRVALTTSPGSFDYVVDRLAEHVAGGVLTMPSNTGDKPLTADRYNLAGELALRGVELAFVPETDSTYALYAMRGEVARLVRDGLPRDAAIRALTINPSTVLGLAERSGTIEKGKTADLAFFDGDPLDPASRAVRVVIEGETVWTRDGEDE